MRQRRVSLPAVAVMLGVLAGCAGSDRPKAAEIPVPDTPALSLAVSPDGSLIAVGDARGNLTVLRMAW